MTSVNIFTTISGYTKWLFVDVHEIVEGETAHTQRCWIGAHILVNRYIVAADFQNLPKVK